MNFPRIGSVFLSLALLAAVGCTDPVDPRRDTPPENEDDDEPPTEFRETASTSPAFADEVTFL